MTLMRSSRLGDSQPLDDSAICDLWHPCGELSYSSSATGFYRSPFEPTSAEHPVHTAGAAGAEAVGLPAPHLRAPIADMETGGVA